jgi:CBS domain-containing protein
MIQEDVIRFLKGTPPFQFLEEKDLRRIGANLTMKYYPKGTVILRQDAPPSQYLQIIKKGGVKVSRTAEDGEELLIDFRSEGENFGFLSMVNRDRVRSTITAVDDTICYLLPQAVFTEYLDASHAFTEYFLKTHMTKYIDRTLEEVHAKSLFFGGSDRILFTTRVGEIISRRALTAKPDLTIRQAARVMTRERASSLVVVDGRGGPLGILTDTDFRQKVVAQGRSLEEAATQIMTAPVIAVDADDHCFEVALKMLSHNINHILVVSREGKPAGVLTIHDFMVLQGTSPLSLLKDMEGQQTIGGLAQTTEKMNRIIGLLLKEGAKASYITRIVSELNDRLVRKVLDLAEDRFGEPPVPYCCIVCGSEGRKEQAVITHQDVALILADPASPLEEKQAEGFFVPFTRYLEESFNACCGGNGGGERSLASDPRWCQPLSVWKGYFASWIWKTGPDDLDLVLPFLDFRPILGDYSLAEALRAEVTAAASENRDFLDRLAQQILRTPVPVGFFKSFIVEKGGEHKDELNLRRKGIDPIVDLARLFALELGLRETATLDRIHALRESAHAMAGYADEMEYALELFLLLHIQHQYRRIKEGKPSGDYLNPRHLSHLEKNSFRDAFELISRLQEQVRSRYRELS